MLSSQEEDPHEVTHGVLGTRRVGRTESQIREYFASGGSTLPAVTCGPRPSPVDVPTLAPGGLRPWEPQGAFPQLQAV